MATDRETQLLQAAYASGITSGGELANFMAQVGHESYGLTRLDEGFRYTKGASQITSKVRSALREGPEALEEARIEALQGRPERLAELMYGGRMGNDQPGDGYRYHGRGYIQLTGKNQYREAGEALGLDLVRNPELASDPENAARISTWYWQQNVPATARENARAAGAAINGSDPPNGLADRENRFARWQRDVTPELMSTLSEGRLGQPVQADPARPQPQETPAPTTRRSSFQDAMQTMLPPQNGVQPHVTGHYGEARSARPGVSAHGHGGTDFNYVGGQSGINLRHPAVHSPVTGTVEIPPNSDFNTVGIRDAQGNLHQVLHLDARSVRNGQQIDAGDVIGTMGGRGPTGPGQYAQHVHYQIRDPNGRAVDPERFWNNRTIEGPTQPGTDQRTQRSGALSDGLLKQGERGAEVIAVQEALNRLGYTGRDGRALENRSGIYGGETRYAVEDFQRRHGLKVDGVIGDDTRTALASAAQRPLLSEATHPNHRLYAHFGRELPAGTPPAAVANVTLQALENGISRPDQIRGIGVRGSDVVIARQGIDPGDRIQVDLSAPTATMQQMSDHTRRQSLQAADPQPSHRVQPDTQELAPRTVSI